jgi:NO-binding membrane sensor protein with MHYT domain/two-component sensor histidine kinase
MDMAVHYQPVLVALSVAVSIFTAYVALDLASQQKGALGPARWLWLTGSAVAMGGGIWSMHFIGMLAMVMPASVAYDLPLTLASLILPILVSGGGLALVGESTSSWWRLCAGGLLMGLGIVVMHYAGMAAMSEDVGVVYDGPLVACSVLIAVAASTAALKLAGCVRNSWQRFVSAVIMGLAVVSMHYTGMAAASLSFTHELSHGMHEPPVGSNLLAVQVAGVAGVVLALALASSSIARSKAERRAAEAQDDLARERQKTEITLRQSEERYRLAIQATGLGTWDWDVDANVLIWSARSYELFGLPVGTPISYRIFLGCLDPDDRAGTEAAVRAALEPSGTSSFLAEFRVALPSGETRWIRSQGQTQFVDEGLGVRPVRFLGTVLDITAARLAEQQLIAAVAEKEMLLCEVHHRVKNNMQAITAILQMESRQVTDPMARDGFAAVAQRIQAMARLHQQLYVTNDFRRIDLAAYLHELADSLSSFHSGLPVTIEVVADPLRCDLDMAIPLGLIANELVTNSLKHAYPNGRQGVIRLRLGQGAGAVMFEVSDDGIGSTGDGRAGGLGNLLVEALAQQLGAALTVERTGGHCCRLSIPTGNLLTGQHCGESGSLEEHDDAVLSPELVA